MRFHIAKIKDCGSYGFFKDKKTQREFLESVAKKFGVSKPTEWTKVEKEDILKMEGGEKLLKMHDKSMFKLLSGSFPGIGITNRLTVLEIVWKPEWFSNRTLTGYWPSTTNQRQFLESVAKKLGVKKPRDWGKITHLQFRKFKGGGTLLNMYGGSLRKALETIYPGLFYFFFHL